MKSRSYCAIVGSSLLLLSVSCTSQSSKSAEQAASLAPPRGDVGSSSTDESSTAAEEHHGDGGDEKADAKADTFGRGVSVAKARQLGSEGAGAASEEGGTGDEGSEGAPGEERRLSADGCADGEMQFEGACRSKEKVKKILDKRKREAMDSYRKAKRPEEAAQAAHDLLEQQVAQVEKTEDDLDEILEMLREEQKKGAPEKEGP